jgi:cobalt-zinc-cadmium efflux system outer membrane protein
MKSAFRLAAALICMAAQAQDLSPEDAVAQALNNNAFLRAASARTQAAEGGREQAGLRPNPRLFVQVENLRAGGNTPFQFSRDPDNFLYASQVLEMGGKRQSRMELARQAVRASEAEREVMRAQVAGRVLSAYWAAVGAHEVESVLAATLDNLERTVQYHRDRVREGAIAEVDLMRVEIEFRQIGISYDTARQEAAKARTALFREMGRPEPLSVTLTGNLMGQQAIPVIPIEEALERRTDVRLAQQEVMRAKAGVQLQRANARPDPEVLMGYKRTGGYDTLIAGIQMDLPLRNRNQGAIAAASASERAAEASLDGVRATAVAEIASRRGEYEQKQRLLTHDIPEVLAQAQETARIAQAVYREGGSDILRLLDAERTRLQMELLSVRTAIEYKTAVVALQTALGLLP